jgi:hypothetical protein
MTKALVRWALRALIIASTVFALATFYRHILATKGAIIARMYAEHMIFLVVIMFFAASGYTLYRRRKQ